MKKVVFLVPWLSGYGGTETVIHNLFKEYFQNHSNFSFELYSIGGFIHNTNLKFKNVHIIQLFSNKLLKLFEKRKARNLVYSLSLPLIMPYILLKTHPDILIATNPVLWTIAKFYVNLFHMKSVVVGWYHYSFKAKHVKLFFLKWPDYYLTISKSGKRELIQKGVNSNKIFVVYNPLIPSNNIIKESKDHNQFVYVGRIEFNKQKNISELFQALSNIPGKWNLRIYGKCVNKDDLYKLKALGHKLGINKYIKWMGFKKHVFDKIHVADALLLSSNYEGFPMVIAEAMSHGLYVISSNCPDGPSELINKSNGRMYKMHDIKQFSNLICNVINGKTQTINQDKIINSISFLYARNYYKNFINKLNVVLKK